MDSDIIEEIFLSVQIVGFLFSPRMETRRVLLWEASLTAVESVFTYISSHRMANKITKGIDVDYSHIILMKQKVLLMMMNTFSYFMIRRSADETTRTAYAFSRYITYSIWILVMLLAHIGDFLKQSHLAYVLVPTVALAMVMRLRLVATGKQANNQVQKSVFNFFLTLDVALNVLIGVADLVLPALLSHIEALKLDTFHVYLYCLNGAVSLGNASFSWLALRFTFEVDKKAVMVGRMLGCTECLALLRGSEAMLMSTLSARLFALRHLPLLMYALSAWVLESIANFDIENVLRDI